MTARLLEHVIAARERVWRNVGKECQEAPVRLLTAVILCNRISEADDSAGIGADVTHVCRLLARALPLDTPWSEAVELLRPSLEAMAFEPDVLVRWTDAVARTTYDHAMADRRSAG